MASAAISTFFKVFPKKRNLVNLKAITGEVRERFDCGYGIFVYSAESLFPYAGFDCTDFGAKKGSIFDPGFAVDGLTGENIWISKLITKEEKLSTSFPQSRILETSE